MTQTRTHFVNYVTRFCIACFIGLATGCTGNQEPAPAEPGAPASSTVEIQAESQLQRARRLLAEGNSEAARRIAQELLVASPESLEAMQVLRSAYSRLGNHLESAELAVRMIQIDSTEAFSLHTSAFHSFLQAGEFGQAERQLLKASALRPQDLEAMQNLVQLYNSQGRRFEACQVAQRMAEIDFPGMGVLISLVERAGPFRLSDFGEFIPEDRVTLFDLGKARMLDMVDSKFEEAYETTKRVASEFPDHPAVQAYLGRLIAYREIDNTSRLTEWLKGVDARTRDFPDYWHALGVHHRRNRNDQAAVRAFAEAIRLDPTDRVSLREIVSALNRLGQPTQAQSVQNTINDLDEIFRLSDRNKLTAERAVAVAERLTGLYRPWEGLRWQQIATSFSSESDRPQHWANRAKQIQTWSAKTTPEKLAEVRLTKMLGFDPREYPLIDQSDLQERIVNINPENSPSSIRLTNVSHEFGLNTVFQSGYPVNKRDFLLFQANGGGLAAFDYDLDGYCDVYVVQSGGHPQHANDSSPNELYRNVDASSFLDSSESSGTDDRGFGQGVCVGDLNQDGWPDLVIGNFGPNAILINQGDGTFRDANDEVFGSPPKWTSSVAIGDVNGDDIPDIVEANYIDDDNVFSKRCVGATLSCHPQLFTPAVDRVFVAQARWAFCCRAHLWGNEHSAQPLTWLHSHEHRWNWWQ